MLVDTLLFVDVDGVLNIGIKDESGSPLDLTAVNVTYARKMWSQRKRHKARTCIERTVAACERKLGHGEESTYEKLCSDPNTGVSDILIERLAVLIHSMEGRGLVVLSSTWRKPRHAARVARLEAAIAYKLGAPFKFHAKTELRDDSTPGLRLEAIGDFLSSHCSEFSLKQDLRVLVLEDFHVGPVGHWVCGETVVESISAAEEYLETRAPGHVSVSARVIHTYDEFVTPDGLRVQLGCGLTCDHFYRAHRFLAGSGGFGSSMTGTQELCSLVQTLLKVKEAEHLNRRLLSVTDDGHQNEHSISFFGCPATSPATPAVEKKEIQSKGPDSLSGTQNLCSLIESLASLKEKEYVCLKENRYLNRVAQKEKNLVDTSHSPTVSSNSKQEATSSSDDDNSSMPTTAAGASSDSSGS